MNSMMICGKIGNKEIAKDDISHFVSSVKDFEWTANNIYKPAKVVEVKPTFSNPKQSENPYQPHQAKIDSFLVEETNHLADFQQYKSQCEDRKYQQIGNIAQQRNDFIKNYFPLDNLSEDSEKTEIIAHIKMNKSKIVMNSNLNSKLGNYIGYLNSQQNLNSNYNFDFTKQKYN